MFAIDSIVTTDRVRYTTDKVVRTTDRVNIYIRQSSTYKSGAPNKNIVQNQLNTALLDVF